MSNTPVPWSVWEKSLLVRSCVVLMVLVDAPLQQTWNMGARSLFVEEMVFQRNVCPLFCRGKFVPLSAV